MAQDILGDVTSSNSITVPISSPYASKSWTLSLWFYARAWANFKRLWENVDNSGNVINAIYQGSSTPGRMTYGIFNANTGGTSTTISSNAWHHVVFVNDTTNGNAANPTLFGGSYAFLDSIVDFQSAGRSGTLTLPMSSLGFGQQGNVAVGAGGSAFPGILAHVAYWNKPFVPSQCLELWAGKSPLLMEPEWLVSYWPLDGYGGPVQDLGLYKNHGVVHGTIFASGPPRLTTAQIRRPLPFPEFVTPPMFVPPPQILMAQACL